MPDFEDKIPISEFSYTNDLHNDDALPIIQQSGGDWDNFKTFLSDLALFINKYMEYTTDLHTTSKKIIGAINELADNPVDVDITTEIDTPAPIQSFSDGGDNIPLKSCDVAIVAQQASGTPSPSNPLSITGFSSIDVSVSNGVDTPTVHTVPLGQTIYGGTADVVNGNGSKTYVNAVHTWSEFGNRTTLGSYVRGSLTLTEGTGINTNPNDLCNIAPFKASYSADEGHFYIGVSGGNTIAYVFVPTGTSEDTSIQIVYELATPTAFTFTGAIIPTLSGTNNIYADSGDIQSLEYFNDKGDDIASMVRLMTR